MATRKVPVVIWAMVAAILVLLWSSNRTEAAREKVSFTSANVALQSVGSSLPDVDASLSPVPLQGFLYRPNGAGPFPAVVLLPGCGGVTPNHEFRWAEWFQSKGYVALVVDSLTTRHKQGACTPAAHFTALNRAGDPFGALVYLRTLSFVEADHIGVVGWSQGGGVALLAARQKIVDSAQLPGGGFRAAIAFYPPCDPPVWGKRVLFMSTDIRIPLLLILAANDNWVLPGYCQNTALQMQQEGRTVLVETFGVTHGFDYPGPTTPHTDNQGHTFAYDPVATSAAEKLVEIFLLQYLR